MTHPIYRVVSFQITDLYTLRVAFDDGAVQVVDFSPIMEGDIYSPLRDLSLFNQVRIDPEVHTLTWPNGADFDPAILHDWPAHLSAMMDLAQGWGTTASRAGPV